MAYAKGPGLYDFLRDADLQQYYSALKNKLKIQKVAHFKDVKEQDLSELGMTKPEIRRLRKYFAKHFPQNYFAKFKNLILPKDEKDNWDVVLPEESGSDSKPPVKVPNKHIIPADSILVNKELGTGEFGIVQQGVWTNDGDRIQVAIKCLSRERMQNNPIEFLKEAAIMHSIDHEHIVRLYGVVLDTNALMLVTELAPLRSLLECLKEPSLRTSFPILTLCDFSIQICDGMQYLETKRLIHRDLAARNILVFSKNKVKISDFGLSRALGVGKDYYQTNFNVNLKLPIAWCAPECISYLRFTSASDVWAFGVTLWEMFSYGFQPWAALTGHQILEAIDEPYFQRLEQPECCPKEYYSLMLKCWQHDANKRPRFCDLMNLLPDCKPEQVQAIQDCPDERVKRDQLSYRTGDIITVLHKTPVSSLGNSWKGVLNNGKSGFFNPAYTVSYIGANLPSNKHHGAEFSRTESRIYASRRNRIRPEMISCPQGEVKHTGHVGLDGAYFGDISFLSPGTTKYNLPHQVVAPYKPQEDSSLNSTELATPAKLSSDRAPLILPEKAGKNTRNEGVWVDYESLKCGKSSKTSDHEYHEINGEDPSSSDSPPFQSRTFDFGPSLMDEMDAMLKTLGSQVANSMAAGISNYASSPPPSPLDADVNKKNELRELAAAAAAATSQSKGKKKATVKPISAAEERTLDTAIAIANEFAFGGGSGVNLEGGPPPESPVTPVSPNKRKFSFKFPTPANMQHTSRPDGKTFSDEAASIPDIQGCLSEEARDAYNTLIGHSGDEKMDAGDPSSDGDTEETMNPLRMLKAVPALRSKKGKGAEKASAAAGKSKETALCGNRSNGSSEWSLGNAIPLPPRDRTKPSSILKPRHQRKHPLILPNGTTGHDMEINVKTNCLEADDSFEQRIASELDALDELPAEASTDDSVVLGEQAEAKRKGEMNCEGVSNASTDVMEGGECKIGGSDEVRIMEKVLGPAITGEMCLSALRTTDWNVHRAIKLARLECLLSNGTGDDFHSDSVANVSALEAMNWDVAKAATLILDNLKPQ